VEWPRPWDTVQVLNDLQQWHHQHWTPRDAHSCTHFEPVKKRIKSWEWALSGSFLELTCTCNWANPPLQSSTRTGINKRANINAFYSFVESGKDLLRAVEPSTHQMEMNALQAIDGDGSEVSQPILRPSTSRFWALIARLRRFCTAIFIYQLPTPKLGAPWF